MMKPISAFVLFIFIFALFSRSNPVHACTQPPEPIPTAVTLEERVNNAPIILVGQVIEYDDEVGYNFIAGVQVERYLKGEGTSPIQISGFGYSSMCLTGVTEGSRYIFFARPDGDMLRGIYYGGHSPIAIPSDENIDTIIAITGESGVIPNEGEDIVEADDWTTVLWIGSGISIVIFVSSLFIIMQIKRDPRKKKAKRE